LQYITSSATSSITPCMNGILSSTITFTVQRYYFLFYICWSGRKVLLNLQRKQKE
jgi:hypothetical protein